MRVPWRTRPGFTSIEGSPRFYLAAIGVAVAAPRTADEVVRVALERHPDVVAARAALTAAEGERAQVGTFLANPEVQAGFSVTGDLTFVQAQQPISLTGEGWSARKQARGARDAAVADLRRSELVIAVSARRAWADAVAADRRAKLCDEALAQATRFRDVVEARAGAGDLSALDVALARSRQVTAASDALEARQDRVAALADLAAIDRDAVEVGTDILAAVPSASTHGSRSDVAAAEARLAQMRASLSRNRAAAVPLVAAGVQYQSDGGSVDLGPMLTVALPVFDRNQAGIARARGDVDVASAALEATKRRADAEGKLAVEAADAADRTWTSVRDADAAARDGLGFVETAFRRGELDVREALLLQRELLEGRLASIDAEDAVVQARLSAMLAVEDRALLGEAR